jgi:hypothetical protein
VAAAPVGVMPAHAQGTTSRMQRTVDGIRNEAFKNLGKEVVLDCVGVRATDQSSLHKSASQQGLALFWASDEDYGAMPVLVNQGDASAFVKQFGTETKYYGYRKRTRQLRGLLTAWDGRNPTSFPYYLRYGGAKEWVNLKQGSAPSSGGAPEPEKKVAFDEKPMTSFSYDGKRLAEARIVDVGREGVVLTDKDAVSVIVPLEKAVKMPDLRMKAKEAMEAALASD